MACCLTESGDFNGGWTAQIADTQQFLQIDLGNVTMVTGVLTQGNFAVDQWVKSYTLAYSNIDGNFTSYNNDQVNLKKIEPDRNKAKKFNILHT